MNRHIVLLQPDAPPKKVWIGSDENAILDACKVAFGDANFTQHIPLYATERFDLHMGLFVRDMPDPDTDRPNALASKIAYHCHDRAYLSRQHREVLGPAVLYDDVGSVDAATWNILNKIIRAKRSRVPPPEIIAYWNARPLSALPPTHPSLEIIAAQRDAELNQYGREC